MIDFNMRTIVERLSPRIVSWLEDASHMAIERRYEEILVDDLAMMQMKSDTSMLVRILRHSRIDIDAVWQVLTASRRRRSTCMMDKPAFSSSLMQVLEQSCLVAVLRYQCMEVDEAALVEAMIRYYHANAHPLSDILEDVDMMALRELGAAGTVIQAGSTITHGSMTQPGDEMPWLTDFTLLAEQNELDPVFGRDDEIRSVIDILCRRRKNNPILVGEPGVGKTAIAEGLAIRIHEGRVPGRLADARLLQMDMGSLQAGASVKGEFERRIRDTLEHIASLDQQVVLFVDEAHTLIGAGGEQGTGDASNLLKPALARGSLRMIAATTWSEYKQYLECDAALARRFQMVKVGEPDDETAIRMLTGLADRYRDYHGVHVSYDAIEQAVRLSRRYITGRYLPDKAIDLIDTACARISLSTTMQPPGMEDLRAAIQAAEDRKTALENDRKAGLQVDERRLTETMADLQSMRQRFAYENDHQQVCKPQGTDQPEPEVGNTVDGPDGADLRKWPSLPCVTSDVVVDIVSEWTGVPADHMRCEDLERYACLEQELASEIIGQDMAIGIVSDAIRTSVAGLGNEQSPMNVFLFFGPTGVGKTELARSITSAVHGDMRNLVTLNMSEYQESHTVAQLKGAPPGYVGYGKGGILTEAVRRMPYSVILLDEIEKAHRDVMDIFYQVFDKGFMRDGEGREVDFRNTIIVMTSNLGDDHLLSLIQEEQSRTLDADSINDRMRPVLARHFPHALLARMTLVPFRPLDVDTLSHVAARRLSELGNRLSERHGIELVHDADVAGNIARLSESSMQGARAVNAIIDTHVRSAISRAIIGEGSDYDRIVVSASGSGLELAFEGSGDDHLMAG